MIRKILVALLGTSGVGAIVFGVKVLVTTATTIQTVNGVILLVVGFFLLMGGLINVDKG